MFRRTLEIERRTVVFWGGLLFLAILFGLFVVKSVKKADVVVIHQQQKQKQVQREHLSDRQQIEEGRIRSAPEAGAKAEEQSSKAIEFKNDPGLVQGPPTVH